MLASALAGCAVAPRAVSDRPADGLDRGSGSHAYSLVFDHPDLAPGLVPALLRPELARRDAALGALPPATNDTIARSYPAQVLPSLDRDRRVYIPRSADSWTYYTPEPTRYRPR